MAILIKTRNKWKPYSQLINYVPDRLGHDYRYAIDTEFIKKTIGWESQFNFKETLRDTVEWCLNNQEWSLNLIQKNSILEKK